MNVLLAFLAFNFIVIVHELGHFWAAKLSGIRIKEFSLFVGPKLFSIKRGETVYSLRLFPILAYVKMEGEEEASDSDMAYNKKSPLTRLIVSFAGPFANIIIAVVLLSIVFAVSGYGTNIVGEIAPGSPAEKAGILKGDRIMSYEGKKVYQPVDLFQFAYIYKDKQAEILILRDGKKISTLLTPELMPEQKRYLFGFLVQEASGTDSNVIKELLEGSPASKAGLKPGDRILRLNDVPVGSKEDVDAFMQKNSKNPVSMTILRNNAEKVFELTPMLDTVAEQYYIGLDLTNRHGNIFEVIGQSFVYTWSTIRNVAYGLIWLISGKVSLNQMLGPVGIVSTITDVVKQSPTPSMVILNLLNITAFISIALGATNLVPFPALDGSKLILVAVEVIRKKPLSPEKEAMITMVGFGLIILLAVFTFYNDTLRLFSGG